MSVKTIDKVSSRPSGSPSTTTSTVCQGLAAGSADREPPASSGGIVRMGPATLYGTLKKLVDKELAEELPSRPSTDDDQRRRYYRLTVPPYHLERIMNERRSNLILSTSIGLLAIGGVAVLYVGAVPGLAILGAAVILAVAQGSHLARSLKVSNPPRRNRRFMMAATSAGVAIACYAIFLATVDGESWSAVHPVLYLVGNLAMLAAPAFLIAGLLASRSATGSNGPRAGAAR